ncbi:hypothetical protein [Halovivax gelatinilyticus]|uniref:hypothetical protein n=1 Tax=Halovivax gelatinilyticus TaxID=2961597 RepID=UPI0020CA5334|nr:hypothetical protein [Halovivax gelatinilyticus]
MGEFASKVQTYIYNRLSESNTSLSWQTEYDLAGTPVDIGGENDKLLVLLELEWRRADPADNSAKIFRHLTNERTDVDIVLVAQIFTNYYDLASGGVSSKRKNAEFVGAIAAGAIDDLSYHPVEFPLEPPKQGNEWQSSWTEAAEYTTVQISDQIQSVTDPD